MGQAVIGMEIQFRDDFGNFAAACNRAAKRAAERTAEFGARSARAHAPAGQRRSSYASRPGYVPLKRSIKVEVVGTKGWWYSIAPHARYVEEGTAAHIIHGKMYFPWKGGFFVWNDPHFGPIGSGKGYENWDGGRRRTAGRVGAWVFHPGTQPNRFLNRSFISTVESGKMMEFVREEFARI